MQIQTETRAQIVARLNEKDRLLMQWIKVDLTGRQTVVTCKHCNQSVEFAISDDFVTFSVWYRDKRGDERSRQFHTNKAVMKWFHGEHWYSCIRHKARL